MKNQSLLDQGVKSDPNGVDRPAHYLKHPSGVEAIEICRHMTFNLGNAMKYLFRLQDKDGPLKNAQKALWYVVDEQNFYHPTRVRNDPESYVICNPQMKAVLLKTGDEGLRHCLRYVYLADISREGYYFDQARIYLARLIATYGG